MTNKTIAGMLWVAVLLILPAAMAMAQERPVRMKDCPPAVQKTIQEQSKGAKIRGISKEVDKGKTVYELELMVDGHTKDVLIDSGGNVAEVEEETTVALLPTPVRTEIEKQAGKGRIVKVESLSRGGSIFAYEALIKSGAKSKEIKVDSAGKLMLGK